VFLYLPLKTYLAFRVDRRKRLVHQPKRSRHDQQARESQSPSLAVRKILCRQITQMAEIHSCQSMFGFARTAVVMAVKLQIFEQGKLIFYAIVVAKPSDCGDALLGIGNDAIRTHAKGNAPARDIEQPGNCAEQRSFPRSVWAVYRKEFASRNGEADVRLKQTAASRQRQTRY
jgi:hypothetical protein